MKKILAAALIILIAFSISWNFFNSQQITKLEEDKKELTAGQSLLAGELNEARQILEDELKALDAEFGTRLGQESEELEKKLAAGQSLLLGELNKDRQSLKDRLESLDLEFKTAISEESDRLEKELSISQSLAAEKVNEMRQTLAALEILEKNLEVALNFLETNLNGELAELENKIFEPAKIYEKTKKAIVGITSMTGRGTGFLFGKNNQIVTAYHVIKAGVGTTVSITPNDGHLWMLGKVKIIKPEWDLAVIELPEPLNAEPLMPAINPTTGEPVLIIGNPAWHINSASTGIISGTKRKLSVLPDVDFIQIDASIFPGNSGGPVLDKEGKAIGVVSHGINDSFIFGFAVTIDYVNKLFED